jgi:hypothetical protein
MQRSLFPDPVSASVDDVAVLEQFELYIAFRERKEGLTENIGKTPIVQYNSTFGLRELNNENDLRVLGFNCIPFQAGHWRAHIMGGQLRIQ